jgi:hypothetical protein
MNIEKLNKRIQILEDLESIKRLKADYAFACDDNYDLKKLEKLFVKNAVWDGGDDYGIYEGWDSIKKFYKGISENISCAMHYFTLPNIEVNGEIASGSWYMWMISIMKDGKEMKLNPLLSIIYEKDKIVTA